MSLLRAVLAASLTICSMGCLWLAVALLGAHVPHETSTGLANLFVVRFVSVTLFIGFIAFAAGALVIVAHSDQIKEFFRDR